MKKLTTIITTLLTGKASRKKSYHFHKSQLEAMKRWQQLPIVAWK